MQENNQDSTDIKDYVTPAVPHGEKVIQPSASFIQEMEGEPANSPASTKTPVTPPLSANVIQATQPVQPLPIKQASATAPPASSVYPDTTGGTGVVAG